MGNINIFVIIIKRCFLCFFLVCIELIECIRSIVRPGQNTINYIQDMPGNSVSYLQDIPGNTFIYQYQGWLHIVRCFCGSCEICYRFYLEKRLLLFFLCNSPRKVILNNQPAPLNNLI